MVMKFLFVFMCFLCILRMNGSLLRASWIQLCVTNAIAPAVAADDDDDDDDDDDYDDDDDEDYDGEDDDDEDDDDEDDDDEDDDDEDSNDKMIMMMINTFLSKAQKKKNFTLNV